MIIAAPAKYEAVQHIDVGDQIELATATQQFTDTFDANHLWVKYDNLRCLAEKGELIRTQRFAIRAIDDGSIVSRIPDNLRLQVAQQPPSSTGMTGGNSRQQYPRPNTH